MFNLRMGTGWIQNIAAVLMLFSISSCAQSPGPMDAKSPAPIDNPSTFAKEKSNRLLGLHMTQGSVGFDKSYATIKDLGINILELPIQWDEYEPTPHAYINSWLPDANRAFPKDGIKIGLILNPIDTNVLRLPKDLRGKKFSDPQVIDRYKGLIDFIARTLPDAEIVYFAVGNEINAYLLDSDDKWSDYTKFYNAVAPYARKIFPHAVVSSKMIYGSLMKDPQRAQGIINNSDAVLVTYYPQKDGISTAIDPVTVHDDFKRIINLYPNKKVYFTEVGYPSSEKTGSSEAKQAEFIHEMFSAWDENMSHIPLVNYFWLHDISSDEMAKAQEYYHTFDAGIAAYFSTIGLRTYNGKSKQGFIQFSNEAKKRGW